ncbi:MAG: hypothetical protein GX589_04535, partial [Deltaproteobacteria bacterium]|nr:hypothetical protein [Deltaproteobacteria bacterium]
LVSRNGWRDGVVIAALRENRCLIFDEFPHFKQWHMLNSLMTASPGQSWYFADNDEWIDIPKNWRMYFTGNIGSRHGGYSTAEKMASRVAGMVLEVDYPSKRTELTTALALICDRDGNILLDKNDQAKLFVLVNDVFPKLRALITNEKHTVPLSYRTLQNLAEKLVQRHDPETGAPTPRARGTKSFDQALLEEVLDSYALWDNRKIKGNIVDIMTSVGLLLDDSVKERVLPYINPQIYEERKEIFSKMKGDFDKVTAALRGYADGAQISANTLPQVF